LAGYSAIKALIPWSYANRKLTLDNMQKRNATLSIYIYTRNISGMTRAAFIDISSL